MPDDRRPWERQPGESARPFAAASEYILAGPQRSLAKVGQKLGKSVVLLERWSSRHDWVNRASAYDDHLAEVERAEQRRLAEEKAKVWADREEALRERRWTLSQEMLGKAELMIRTPIVRKEVQGDIICESCGWKGSTKGLEFPDCPICGSTRIQGGNKVSLVPAKWNFNTARLLVAEASRLADTALTNGGKEGDEASENGAIYDFKNEDYEK